MTDLWEDNGVKPGMHSLRKALRKNWIAYLFVLPCAVILVLMIYNPLVQTIRFSLSKVLLPSFDTQYAALTNFTRAFGTQDMSQILFNTILWVFGTLLLRFVLGFGAAITMDSRVGGILVFRILALIPWTVPSIVAANLWRWLLQTDFGLVNQILKGLGAHAGVNWLGSAHTALLSVLVAYSWAGYPFVMIMLLAGMQGIPEVLYDAAKIDGANGIQTFLHVTLPSLRTLIVILVLLEIVSGFNSFDLLFVMTGGGPGVASLVLGLYIYRLGFTNFDFGAAAAVSAAMLAVAIVFFLFYVPSSRRGRGTA